METKKKVKRSWTAEQKFSMLQEIEKMPSIQEGLDKFGIRYNLYSKWKRQLAVGVNASLRSSRPIKAPDIRRLEIENRKLKEMVLNQSLYICELKKEMRLD